MDEKTEAFPTLSPISTSDAAQIPLPASPQQDARTRRATSDARARATSSSRKTRSASLLQSVLESNPPLGAWQAITEDTMKSPTLPEIRNGSYSAEGWSHEGQLEKRHQNPHDIHKKRLTRTNSDRHNAKSTRRENTISQAVTVPEEAAYESKESEEEWHAKKALTSESLTIALTRSSSPVQPIKPNEEGQYPNGYRFPKKHTWKQSCTIYARAFWKFFLTVKGFLITIYALNVVAWGAMIFFLLIPGATPAMCKSWPNCEDKQHSARQIWIENCSQILTALFSVTAYGLLPWRLRDFYYMLRYQIWNDYHALRRLAGFYRGWYRLPGSEALPESLGPPPEPKNLRARKLFSMRMWSSDSDSDVEKADVINDEIAALEANPAVPLPPWSMPPAPLTGIRARPTKFKALAIMIWMYIWNTLFQVGLCVVMWRFNRFQRNTGYFTALTALFIVCGCFTGIGAGIVVGREGKVIKETEGIPIKDYDVPESAEDYQERIAKRRTKEAKHQKNQNQQKL